MDTPNIPEASTFDQQTAKTTVTTFRIVEALKRQPWTRVSDLADDLDLAKGTVHKHLSTLQKVNYVVQEGEQYRLSLRFMGLGTTARSNLEIYQVAYRSVEKLAEATGEVASIMIAENGYGVYVLRVSAEGRPDIDIREGDSVPLTATAGGKAILANMSTEERDHIIDRNGLPELTEDTITDPAELRDELRRVRNRRRAIDRGEYRPDQRCVAAPITNLEGNPLGAVIVSGPSDRMNEKVITADFTSLVGSTADSIQSHLYQ